MAMSSEYLKYAVMGVTGVAGEQDDDHDTGVSLSSGGADGVKSRTEFDEEDICEVVS